MTPTSGAPPDTTPCERCGTPLILVNWDEGRQWMERVGRTLGMNDVWMTHTPKNCTSARERALARTENR